MYIGGMRMAGVAQPVEHLTCNQVVAGSSPAASFLTGAAAWRDDMLANWAAGCAQTSRTTQPTIGTDRGIGAGAGPASAHHLYTSIGGCNAVLR